MEKDETLKNIKAGNGLPPIGGNSNNNGLKKETRSSDGLKVMTFSANEATRNNK